jgi:hypothetical protein
LSFHLGFISLVELGQDQDQGQGREHKHPRTYRKRPRTFDTTAIVPSRTT